MGVGDRFAHHAKAQLQARLLAANAEVEIVPVWNKSNREHVIIGSERSATHAAANAVVKELGWTSYPSTRRSTKLSGGLAREFT